MLEYRTKRYLKYQNIHNTTFSIAAIFLEPGLTIWQAIPFKRKFYLNCLDFEKYVLKVGFFLAQPVIFTTFPFWTASFLNWKVPNILFIKAPFQKGGKL